MARPQILLTNDDGIQSPGLWAAAQALAEIGFVTVAAPREQATSTGRSMPNTSDGIIRRLQVQVGGQSWEVFSVGGTPAQTVAHAVLEILPAPPDLVVSGINYGENVGTGITISGTVGAALEAASLGLRALAVSQAMDAEYHFSHSEEIDFGPAAYFTALFARRLLSQPMPPDVDLLKVDVPVGATTQTPWEITRISRHRYYESLKPNRTNWEEPAPVQYKLSGNLSNEPAGTDVYAIHVHQTVSVTPLSLDMTSRVALPDLDGLLRGEPD